MEEEEGPGRDGGSARWEGKGLERTRIIDWDGNEMMAGWRQD